MRVKSGRTIIVALALIFLASSCDLLFKKATSMLETTVNISGTLSLPSSVAPGKYVYVGLLKTPFNAPSSLSSWAKYYQYSIAPGTSAQFSFSSVVSGKYVVGAFYDLNGNLSFDAGEPSGGYPAPNGNPLFDFSSDFSQANVAIVANDVAPTVGLSAASKSFFAALGGANPSAATIAVTNIGGGTLDALTATVSYASGAGWLDATLSAATAPATLTLQAKTGALSAGTYLADVAVASRATGAIPKTVSVSFSVSAAGTAPSIWLSSSNLNYAASLGGANPAVQTIAVSNNGGGELSGLTSAVSYSAGSGSWLTATLDATKAPATLTVQPSTGSLAQGTYSATVVVASSVSGIASQNVNVSFVIAQPPAIALSPTTLRFFASEGGANPATGSVMVQNAGAGTLTGLSAAITYGVDSGGGWLSASVPATVPATAPASMVVQATTGTLAAGSYSATVRVSSSVAGVTAQDIQIAFTVSSQNQGPAIGLETSSLSFSGVAGAAAPSAQTLSVSNAGGGTLSGLAASVTYTSGSAWLTATLSSDTAAPSAILTVQPNVGALAAGTYSATVAITSALSGVVAQNLAVTFVVAPPPPVIGLGSSLLAFSAIEAGANPVAQAVDIVNAGGGTLSGLSANVTYGAGSGWLAATFDSTTAPARMTLQATTGALAAGSYSATVIVSSNVSGVAPQSLNVTFALAQRPKIGLSSSALSFSASAGVAGPGVDPSAQTVAIANTGGGALSGLAATVSYTSGSGWLSATLDAAAAPAALTVQPTTGTLAAGTYAATVSISSGAASNSPQTIGVAFTVTTGVVPPAIGLSPTTLAFSATVGDTGNPAAKTVAVTNTGGGSLASLGTLSSSVSYESGGSGWLTTTVNQSTGVLSAQPALGQLAAGTFTAVIAVSATGAGVGNSPQYVSVGFTVAPQPPKIQLAGTSLSFTANNGGSLPASQTDLITNIGGGSLTQLAASVSYGSGSGWLSYSLNTTTAPATLTVQPNTSSLVIGIYTATISVSSAVASNTPQTVSVAYSVTATPVTGVSLAPTSITLTTAGATSALTATVLPANATNKAVTWSSNNAAVATVSASGVVTAVASGNATITATTVDGAKTATCAVTVTITVPVTGVTLSSSSLTLASVGATSTLTATVSPANATNKAITWSTSNANFGTVSTAGLVTAVAVGKATITVRTTDGNYTATCAVLIAPPPPALTAWVQAAVFNIGEDTTSYSWTQSGGGFYNTAYPVTGTAGNGWRLAGTGTSYCAVTIPVSKTAASYKISWQRNNVSSVTNAKVLVNDTQVNVYSGVTLAASAIQDIIVPNTFHTDTITIKALSINKLYNFFLRNGLML